MNASGLAVIGQCCHGRTMERQAVLERLGRHEPELRALGLCSLALFGSTARGESGPESDVDLAATFDPAKRIGLFHYAAVRDRLGELLGVPVDLVGEPARKARLQAAIDRDRVRVF